MLKSLNINYRGILPEHDYFMHKNVDAFKFNSPYQSTSLMKITDARI